MQLITLWRFLFGDREAILTIARSPQALRVGLLFVLGAGLAREYDKESLVNEPWHLLIPFGASLLTSFVLFNLFYWPQRFRASDSPSFASAYRAFLQVFWMTAPMAWLYAIPWERIFESAADATAANLWTLALVSAWRVLLITRVLSVLFGVNAVGAFFAVMLYSTIAAILSLAMLPFPIMNLMGGIQLGESEQLIASIGMFIMMFGPLSVPIWLIGSLIAVGKARPVWQVGKADTEQRGFGSLGRFAITLIFAGLGLLPLTQPEQMRRYEVESLLKAGELHVAIAFMSEHERADFPPHWDPPPRIGYFDRRPDLFDVAETIAAQGAAGWVRQAYVDKLTHRYRNYLRRLGHGWTELADDPERHWWIRPDPVRQLEAILLLDPSLTDEDRDAIAVIIQHFNDREER